MLHRYHKVLSSAVAPTLPTRNCKSCSHWKSLNIYQQKISRDTNITGEVCVTEATLSLSDLGHSKELVHPFRAVLIWEEIKIWSKYRLLNPNAETSYPIPVRTSTTARESEKRPYIFAKGRWSLLQDQRLAPNSSIRPMTALHCPKIINKTWIACRRHV